MCPDQDVKAFLQHSWVMIHSTSPLHQPINNVKTTNLSVQIN